MEQKALYGEIDDIIYTSNPPLCCAPLKIFFFSPEINFNSSTKNIVYARIIVNNSLKLSYDVIFLKYKKKNVELVFSIMACYWTKSEKGFQIFFFCTINEISSDL